MMRLAELTFTDVTFSVALKTLNLTIPEWNKLNSCSKIIFLGRGCTLQTS